MCYGMHCPYEDVMGDCTRPYGDYPEDAACQYDEESFKEIEINADK